MAHAGEQEQDGQADAPAEPGVQRRQAPDARHHPQHDERPDEKAEQRSQHQRLSIQRWRSSMASSPTRTSPAWGRSRSAMRKMTAAKVRVSARETMDRRGLASPVRYPMEAMPETVITYSTSQNTPGIRVRSFTVTRELCRSIISLSD